MTKQRRLAIQMWQEIVEELKKGDKSFNLVIFKMLFCKKYNLDWVNDCYFCQYSKSCTRCPISDCMSVYTKASHKHDVTSAEIILNALRGGANDYY